MNQLLLGGVFVTWAALHSLLATQWMKHRVKRLLPRGVMRWYRLGYVFVALVSATLVMLVFASIPDRSLYAVGGFRRWFMHVIQSVGLIILIISVLAAYPRHFMGFDAFDRSGSGPPSRREAQDTPQLRTNGLYGLVRHPMYLGSLLVIWFLPVMTINRLILGLLATAYFFLGSIHEEKLLSDEFGPEYELYRNRVPRIVPIPGYSRRVSCASSRNRTGT